MESNRLTFAQNTPMARYHAERARVRRNERIGLMIAGGLAAVAILLLLTGCAMEKDPPYASTGAVITYPGTWGIADELPSGQPGPARHYATLLILPTRTPPLACDVKPQANGDVELTACGE